MVVRRLVRVQSADGERGGGGGGARRGVLVATTDAVVHDAQLTPEQILDAVHAVHHQASLGTVHGQRAVAVVAVDGRGGGVAGAGADGGVVGGGGGSDGRGSSDVHRTASSYFCH